MVSQTYGQVQQRTAGPRDVEYAIFATFTDALEGVNVQENPSANAYSQAIVRNMDLWSRLTVDLANDENQLSEEIRARLISIGEFVRKTSMKRLADRGDLNDLIEINRNLMPGLRAAA